MLNTVQFIQLLRVTAAFALHFKLKQRNRINVKNSIWPRESPLVFPLHVCHLISVGRREELNDLPRDSLDIRLFVIFLCLSIMVGTDQMNESEWIIRVGFDDRYGRFIFFLMFQMKTFSHIDRRWNTAEGEWRLKARFLSQWRTHSGFSRSFVRL